LWNDNRPFQSAMLAADDYTSGALRRKNASPAVWVKKTGE
jgi:hypothetical protein